MEIPLNEKKLFEKRRRDIADNGSGTVCTGGATNTTLAAFLPMENDPHQGAVLTESLVCPLRGLNAYSLVQALGCIRW